ncbi:hypothetical protein G7B40_031785 [Aetokthonos hydrillicola Thurmond2011]|jgi:hypothetical protein|uniref:Uncharacterized protein n=1 Tax=Aetokthonos hydrillicola Thurmond2011 TaxID=2712845 RepID=A0AAP5IEV5_9CYAN|nr:hypothetical protein [Aetokthonos hydrillicola]MBO3461275.1 hypothetical protein [Aetokthonos hydrillicola CCALA 1050]MBW4589614.1 hypothetical protein [Aetokthonos hydrillicola CCALA 1050]MDR9899109.1 hypothetical protein [Aetokthonos hydrillicola Thurmond2011]
MNENQEVQLTLSIGEVNQILDALGNIPYRQIYQLIGKIQRQAEDQLQPPANANILPMESQIVSE